MEKSAIRKTIVIIFVLFIAFFISSCGNRTSKTGEKEIRYSNLASQNVQDKLAEVMTSANISSTRQQVFFDHVNQFNSIVNMKSIATEFESLTGENKYDPYEMQDEWNAKSPDFMGYNCRITAFSLFGDFVKTSKNYKSRENIIMMDIVALEEDGSALLDMKDNASFRALYSTVPTSLTKETNVHVQNLQKDWDSREISFVNNKKASLISVVFHESIDEYNNYLFIGHTGVMFEHDDKLYFIEKIAFQEPYQLTEFSDRIQLNDYLMKKYDTSFNQPTAPPFIMENDKILDGYRTLKAK